MTLRRHILIFTVGMGLILGLSAFGWYTGLSISVPPGVPVPRSAHPLGVDLPLMATLLAIAVCGVVTAVLLARGGRHGTAALTLALALVSVTYIAGWWLIGISGVFI